MSLCLPAGAAAALATAGAAGAANNHSKSKQINTNQSKSFQIEANHSKSLQHHPQSRRTQHRLLNSHSQSFPTILNHSFSTQMLLLRWAAASGSDSKDPCLKEDVLELFVYVVQCRLRSGWVPTKCCNPPSTSHSVQIHQILQSHQNRN